MRVIGQWVMDVPMHVGQVPAAPLTPCPPGHHQQWVAPDMAYSCQPDDVAAMTAAICPDPTGETFDPATGRCAPTLSTNLVVIGGLALMLSVVPAVAHYAFGASWPLALGLGAVPVLLFGFVVYGAARAGF